MGEHRHDGRFRGAVRTRLDARHGLTSEPLTAVLVGALLYFAAGAVAIATVPLLPRDIARWPVVGVAAVGMVTGLLVSWLPWPRWPRWTLLAFPASSHVILSAAWLLAPGAELRYLALYVLCYLFCGLTQRPGVSLALVPVTLLSAIVGGAAHDLDVVVVTCAVGVMVAEVLAQLTSREGRTREHLTALLHVTRELTGATSVGEAAHIVSEQARSIARCDVVLVYTADDEHPGVYVDRASDPDRRGVEVDITTEPTGVGVALRTGEVLMVADAPSSPVVSRRLVDTFHVASAMFVPIPGEARPAGVIALAWHAHHHSVSPLAGQLLEVLRVEAGRVLERLAHTDRLANETVTDPLTGLGNRRRWARDLASLAAGDAVLLLDIDRFKQLNDELGHDRGDTVLATLASCLQHAARGGDTVCRHGGDEFAVILRGAGSTGVATYVERLRTVWQAAEPLTTYSAGWVVAWPGADTTTVLAEADAALYEAKRAGRDRTVGAERP